MVSVVKVALVFAGLAEASRVSVLHESSVAEHVARQERQRKMGTVPASSRGPRNVSVGVARIVRTPSPESSNESTAPPSDDTRESHIAELEKKLQQREDTIAKLQHENEKKEKALEQKDELIASLVTEKSDDKEASLEAEESEDEEVIFRGLPEVSGESKQSPSKFEALYEYAKDDIKTLEEVNAELIDKLVTVSARAGDLAEAAAQQELEAALKIANHPEKLELQLREHGDDGPRHTLFSPPPITSSGFMTKRGNITSRRG